MKRRRIGTGAGVGAIIGGILGGFKGALAGILIGGGGTIAATEGKEVELPPGSVLRVRIDSPVTNQVAADDSRRAFHACFVVPCRSDLAARRPSWRRRAACNRLPHVRVGMRRRQEPRLELRGRRIDAARQHPSEERRVRASCWPPSAESIVAHR